MTPHDDTPTVPRRRRALRRVAAAALLTLLPLALACDGGATTAGDEGGVAATTSPAPDTAVASGTAAADDGAAGAVSAGDGDTAPGTPGGRAYVESVEVMLLESFPLQVRVGIAGNLSDGCTHLGEPQVARDGDTFRVTLPTTREEGMCTQALVPFEHTLPLAVEGLPKGTYTVDVEGRTASFTFERDNRVER